MAYNIIMTKQYEIKINTKLGSNYQETLFNEMIASVMIAFRVTMHNLHKLNQIQITIDGVEL